MDQGHEEEKRDRIHLDSDSSVRYWAKTLHVHPEDLRAAVDAVGTLVDDVRAYLKRRR